MEPQEALRILEYHNKWRRGADLPILNPTLLGIAIDTITEAYIDHSLDEKLKGFVKELYQIDKEDTIHYGG